MRCFVFFIVFWSLSFGWSRVCLLLLCMFCLISFIVYKQDLWHVIYSLIVGRKNVPHPDLTNWFSANRSFRLFDIQSPIRKGREVVGIERRRRKEERNTNSWSVDPNRHDALAPCELPHFTSYKSERNPSQAGTNANGLMLLRWLFISNTLLQDIIICFRFTGFQRYISWEKLIYWRRYSNID